MNMLEYKCPQCGGAIAFDSASQKMQCPYCDASFEMEALKAYDKERAKPQTNIMEWSAPGGQWQDGEQENMAVYGCKSCGGEIVGDETMAATSCPYCGNPVVMTGQFSGALRPDVIIPFKLDKNAAKTALVKHLKGKRLLPKIFKDQNHIDELKGVYVPFWLFDCDVDASIRYKATRITMWEDRKYKYTETLHFHVTREGSVGFENVPVDGSSKIPDKMMESIEPFDWKDAIDFQTAYLAGYLADKYDVAAEASIGRANERIKNSTETAFAATVEKFDTVTAESSSLRLYDGGVRYGLLPVWLLSTRWNKEKYYFAMNGQNGNFVGNLPVDKGAYWRWFVGLFAGLGAVLSGLALLIML